MDENIEDIIRVILAIPFTVEYVSSVLLWTGNQEEDRVLSRPGDPKQHDKDRFQSNLLYIRNWYE